MENIVLKEDLTKLGTMKGILDYSYKNFKDIDFIRYKTPDGIKSRKYSELKKCSDSMSFYLDEKGFDKSHIALIGPTSFEWIASYFGIVDSGNVVVPLATAETDEMNAKLIDFADCDTLVFDSHFSNLYNIVKEKCPSVKHFISLDNNGTDEILNVDDIFSYKDEAYTKNPDGDDVCCIMFTSGTTGFPKGVMLTHANLMYSTTSVNLAPPSSIKKMFCCIPIYHCFGFTAIVTKAMIFGQTVCVNDSLKNLISDLRLYKPNSIMAVPLIVKKIMFGAIKYAKSKPEMSEYDAVEEFLGGEMVNIIAGGAPLEAEVSKRFNATGVLVMNGYGMTECAPTIANNVTNLYKPGSNGKPVPCINVRIQDGEIQCKGKNVMKGYYKNEKATKEAFTDDGWLKTGDLGYIDEDGFLFVTGRCKNLILLDNGENISAEYIENKFSNIPLVKEMVAFGENGLVCVEIFPDKEYIAENNITDIDEAVKECVDNVNSDLAQFQRVSKFYLRDIPFKRTVSQKIKREHIERAAEPKRKVEPKTENEKRVCEAVKSVLDISIVSTDDSFFELGGDSLSVLELAMTLDVEAQVIYDNPIITRLAERLDEQKNAVSADDEEINKIILETAHTNVENEYENILLTGASGFLGVHILYELTRLGKNVICLIRNKDRFDDTVKYYFDEIDLSRVTLVVGNIESEKLGLDDETYRELTKKIDCVIHTAANVHHAGDYKELEKTNVIGTKNIIRFCLDSGAVLEHTSTVSLHGAGTVVEEKMHSVFDENVLNISQRYEDNVYIHSKYEAEKAVINARKSGLKANIFRMGNLTWRASDGKFQKNADDNGFLHRIHALEKLGLVSENSDKFPLELTPVDLSARAYTLLAMQKNTDEIYHIYNPNYILSKTYLDDVGVKAKFVSTAEIIENAVANEDDPDVRVFLFYMVISARSEYIDSRCDYTCEKLSALGFKWNTPDKDYIEKLSRSSVKFTEKPIKYSKNLTPIQKRILSVFAGADLKDQRRIDASVKCIKEILDGENLSRPMFICSRSAEKNMDVAETIGYFENAAVYDSIKGEPNMINVNDCAEKYISNNCDCVIAIGGGSVLDTAKIVSLIVTNTEKSIDDICKIDCTANDGAPLLAVPTTAGTGSEVTMYAVITEEEETDKKPETDIPTASCTDFPCGSSRTDKKPYLSTRFLPNTIIYDESLTFTVPKKTRAYTAIDALSHAFEGYLSRYSASFLNERENAVNAIKTIFEYGVRSIDEPENHEVQLKMLHAATDGGMAIRHSSTGYIHAIAHRLGAIYKLPHGLCISRMFVPVLKKSRPYIDDSLAEISDKCGFADLSLTSEEKADRLIEKIEGFIRDLGIDVSEVKIDSNDLDEIAIKAGNEAGIVGYPKFISDEEIKEMLR